MTMIHAPGIVPTEENPLRFSRLKLMAQSPMHYAHARQSDTDSIAKGSAVHKILLGGGRVTYYPKLTEAGASAPRRGKDWDQFAADNADALIVSRDQYATAMRMVEALRENADAMTLLTGIAEKTILFPFLGLPCRTTPDVRGAGFYTELKTTVSARPGKFMWQAMKMGYHAQMAFHRLGIQRAKLAVNAGDGYIVAVENGGVPAVTIFKVTPKAIEQGEKSIRLWCESLKNSLHSNQWPAYSQSVVDLDMPEDDGLLFPGEDEETGGSPAVPF